MIDRESRLVAALTCVGVTGNCGVTPAVVTLTLTLTVTVNERESETSCHRMEWQIDWRVDCLYLSLQIDWFLKIHKHFVGSFGQLLANLRVWRQDREELLVVQNSLLLKVCKTLNQQ
jgi:hypothetical protein